MAESKSAKAEGLIYKGHPLRRVDNLIYYGTMAEKYIIMMQVLDSKKEQDLDVATRVSVQLQLTDSNLKSRDRVIKKSEKDSLYAAMDVAAIWLDRALAGKEQLSLPPFSSSPQHKRLRKEAYTHDTLRR